jgi:hypothetical protein
MESTMSSEHESLTPAEQQYLERARAAEGEGISLLQYYRAKELSVYSLYNIRRRLIRKGVVRRERAAWSTTKRKSDAFVAVHVTRAARSAELVCRVRHPSGWVIECASWPEPSWISSLLAERP